MEERNLRRPGSRTRSATGVDPTTPEDQVALVVGSAMKETLEDAFQPDTLDLASSGRRNDTRYAAHSSGVPGRSP